MRLTPEEIEIIRDGVKHVFGAQGAVWLFGSRTDDARRGGDIDLYIEAPCSHEQAVIREGLLYAYLLRRLGEQRIDIVVHPSDTEPRPIDRQARQTGIRL